MVSSLKSPSVDPSASEEELDRIFTALKSGSNAEDMANKLSKQVKSLISELHPHDFQKLWENYIYKRLEAEISTTKGAVLTAISHLTDLMGNKALEPRRNLPRLYNLVKTIMPSSDYATTKLAADVLTDILKAGATFFDDAFLTFEIQQTLQLFASNTSKERYAGALLLQTLAIFNPSSFRAHVPLVLEKSLVPMRDPCSEARAAAAVLLARCLDILHIGDESTHHETLRKLVNEARSGLSSQSNKVEVIHRSLLIYEQLFKHGGPHMEGFYVETAEQILRFRNHKDTLVRVAVIRLIPVFASFSRRKFIDHLLQTTMIYLLGMLAKPTDRLAAFPAIGNVASNIGKDILMFSRPVMQQIKYELEVSRREGAMPDGPPLECLALLAAAVGPYLTNHIRDMMDLLFQSHLSETFIDALVAIIDNIPVLDGVIQLRLLDLISIILSGRIYIPMGAQARYARPDVDELTYDIPAIIGSNTPERICLALKTLKDFDFNGHSLIGIVHSCLLPHLSDHAASVRSNAASTACRILHRRRYLNREDPLSIRIVHTAINSLLTIAVTDPDESIRQEILKSLDDEAFDNALSQTENMRGLFNVMNDEYLPNRIIAVKIIGRLAPLNAAPIMASLRKILVQMMAELRYATSIRAREDSSYLLKIMFQCVGQLIRPYGESMFVPLLDLVTGQHTTVAANIMDCIGEFSVVAAEDVISYVPSLMKIIITQLDDDAVVKRDAALRALGQVCSSTGYVIDPLVEYPSLAKRLRRILRSDVSSDTRREVLKVFGILGAIDPYRRQLMEEEGIPKEAPEESKSPPTVPPPDSDPEKLAAYYQTVVFDALFEILDDQTLEHMHHRVIESFMKMVISQGQQCVEYLPKVMSIFITKTERARYKDYYISSLADLVDIIKEHVRTYVEDLVALIKKLWDNVVLQVPLLHLIEVLGKATDTDFKCYLGDLLPLMIRLFDDDTASERRSNAQMKVFDALLSFGSNLEEYIHLVLPVILQGYERDGSVALRKRALLTIKGITQIVNISDHASRIIRSLIQMLSTTPNVELRKAVMEVMCALVIQLKDDFTLFIPSVKNALMKNSISSEQYDALITKLMRGESLPHDALKFDKLHGDERPPPMSTGSDFKIDLWQLRKAWDLSQAPTMTEEHWDKWFTQFVQTMIEQSTSLVLRSCSQVASEHLPFAIMLFNIALLSCWTKLCEMGLELDKSNLATSIESALSSSTIPKDIANNLLRVSEFTSRCGEHILRDTQIGEHAMDLKAFAKALHYKELGYFSEHSHSMKVIEDLIDINTNLRQHDSAFGLITVAQQQQNITHNEKWYERLQRWKLALSGYEKRIREDPENPEIIMGSIRCLHALGEWAKLAKWVNDHWEKAAGADKEEMAKVAADAAWSLSDWNAMGHYIEAMAIDQPEKPFFQAILFVHRDDFRRAQKQIDSARDLLVSKLNSEVEESQTKTYNIMISAQMLSELEEIIQYKNFNDQPERRASMKRMWIKRLDGCQPEVEYWQRILQVRSLVLQPEEDTSVWIQFTNLCRKSNRFMLAEKAIDSLVNSSDASNSRTPPTVVYTHYKFMWDKAGTVDEREAVFSFLSSFTMDLDTDIHVESNVVERNDSQETKKLLSRCYYKQGEWRMILQGQWYSSPNITKDVLDSLKRAAYYDKTWHKAWHTWALANSEVAERIAASGTSDEQNLVSIYVRHAIEGFLWSVNLHQQNALQDTLRLLTLWFKFGSLKEISDVVADGFSKVDIDTWLKVLPQIIARIQAPSLQIREHISQLLSEVGKHHPQALVYPLSVASLSSSRGRRAIALDLFDRMRTHSVAIVEQARLVGKELIKVAITWHDQWFEGIANASMYKDDPDRMIAFLENLHENLDKGPTMDDNDLTALLENHLQEARVCGRWYTKTRNRKEFEKAFRWYQKVYFELEDYRKQQTSLDLRRVSLTLSRAQNLELAVPGTYLSGKDIVYISSFHQAVPVISSKQRPRRLMMKGSDGVNYKYILKGHEDLRQDERIMQMFGLVNALLTIDVPSHKRRLQIRQYPVIPISADVGLIGVVEESDTLEKLIVDHRISKGISVEIEYELILQMAPHYDELPVKDKVEAFEYALENCSDKIIDRSLWDNSISSEHWLKRRSTYTRSLAVGSMVGHILGLGDRHTANIMLERDSGKIVHVDFGECFEVTLHRAVYPEKVPFRLTRMLRRAMEASGIEGTFKNTCQMSMSVLRKNKESLSAMLEAFVYDPLINWRLDANFREQLLGINGKDVQTVQLVEEAQGPVARPAADDNIIFNDIAEEEEVRNERALTVINRVKQKLTGHDFDPNEELTVEAQVDKLINVAISTENLCQHFRGWRAFW